MECIHPRSGTLRADSLVVRARSGHCMAPLAGGHVDIQQQLLVSSPGWVVDTHLLWCQVHPCVHRKCSEDGDKPSETMGNDQFKCWLCLGKGFFTRWRGLWDGSWMDRTWQVSGCEQPGVVQGEGCQTG